MGQGISNNRQEASMTGIILASYSEYTTLYSQILGKEFDKNYKYLGGIATKLQPINIGVS